MYHSKHPLNDSGKKTSQCKTFIPEITIFKDFAIKILPEINSFAWITR